MMFFLSLATTKPTVQQDLKLWLEQWAALARHPLHRHMVLFEGDEPWCYARARESVQWLAPSSALWISRRHTVAGQNYNPGRVQDYLGREFQAVIFDVYSGFDPDLFAAITGTITGGGWLIMLSPSLDGWEQMDDPEKSRLAVWPYLAKHIGGRFLRVVAQRFLQDESVAVLSQNQPLPPLQRGEQRPLSVEPAGRFDSSLLPCRTADQQQAVEAILHVVAGHRHRPLVITSDRGRGKSAALGIAAAQLIKQDLLKQDPLKKELLKRPKKIVVTAPRLAAVASVFQCAKNLLQDARHLKNQLTYGDASLRFVCADDLSRKHYECNLLMVDEAAAIPAALLERYLLLYPRIVFSTTVHGYEGTGRGFVLRFQDKLNQHTPGWRALALQTPIRWAKHDPLEALVFKALLLDAQPAADDIAKQAGIGNCRFEQLDRDTLIGDSRSLSQLFALLVLAHYQTQPADLRYLLDARNIYLYILRHEEDIVAAAVLEEEGAFDAHLASQVYANERRVRGHLLAQSLAAYCGLPKAPLLRFARVMRIAVHPLAQHKGLGAFLLQHIEKSLSPFGVDVLGASFGATTDLLRFWRRAGFWPVHMGLKRNAASGMHAAMVLKPLSAAGVVLFRQGREKFGRHFPAMLGEQFKDLDLPLASQLLIDPTFNGTISPLRALDEEDRRDIESFVTTNRGYEVNAVALWDFVCLCLKDETIAGALTDTQREMLVSKVLQKLSWPEFVSKFSLGGQKQALSQLRKVLRQLYERCAGSENQA